VAVATPKGLVTPVLRNAESMSFIEIEREIASLGKKVSTCIVLPVTMVSRRGDQARDGKLTLEDMAGGSFTMYVSSKQL